MKRINISLSLKPTADVIYCYQLQKMNSTEHYACITYTSPEDTDLFIYIFVSIHPVIFNKYIPFVIFSTCIM